MDLKAYYQRALLLPIVLPIALLPLAIVVPRLPDAARLALVLLWGALVVGGLPYLFFLTIFYILTVDRTGPKVQRAFRLAPLRFASVMCGIVLLFLLAGGEMPDAALTRALWLIAGVTMGVGYFYVALAETGRIVLQRRGHIRETDDVEGGFALPDTVAAPLPSIQA